MQPAQTTHYGNARADPPADATSVDRRINRLAHAAADLGREIVDLAGFLEGLDSQAQDQLERLRALNEGASHLMQVNTSVMETLSGMTATVALALSRLEEAEQSMGDTTANWREMTDWIIALDQRSNSVQHMLDAVNQNNDQIATIAAQVNMLAINAKIEAARAGEAGRGFSVVADAINELSQRTGTASQDVSRNVRNITDWVAELQTESGNVTRRAQQVGEMGEATFAVLCDASRQIAGTRQQSDLISADLTQAQQALQDFHPHLSRISDAVNHSVSGVGTAHKRINRLIDGSETIVQDSVELGGTSDDSVFITAAQQNAAELSRLLEEAVEADRLAMEDLFDTSYRPIPNTDPPQVMARFTHLTDTLFPQVQEPTLQLDPRVVFCAAVDRKGYLPTHNRKFSQRPGKDPVWNQSHCRNRRIFNDRVGLKAGQSTDPFLLQVYRRDMGGGEFVMMKDVSAPITVHGRHWGGLRLAYRF